MTSTDAIYTATNLVPQPFDKNNVRTDGFSALLKTTDTKPEPQPKFTTHLASENNGLLKLAQSKKDEAVDEYMKNIIEPQRAQQKSILSPTSGGFDAFINKLIDMVTKKIVDQTIAAHNLKPDAEAYQAAFDAVRRAVSGETVAESFGLPKGQVATDRQLSIQKEAQLRMDHISKALKQTLGFSLSE